jgi:hypothetical protein
MSGSLTRLSDLSVTSEILSDKSHTTRRRWPRPSGVTLGVN